MTETPEETIDRLKRLQAKRAGDRVAKAVRCKRCKVVIAHDDEQCLAHNSKLHSVQCDMSKMEPLLVDPWGEVMRMEMNLRMQQDIAGTQALMTRDRERELNDATVLMDIAKRRIDRLRAVLKKHNIPALAEEDN